jgi:hypothetical protein
MKRLGTGIALALFSSLGMIAAVGAADAKPESKAIQGELIDTYCYSSGGAKGEGHAKCAAKCMSSGIPAGILVDGKVWILGTNPKPLAQYAAKTIRVTGEMDSDTHMILPDTVEVQEDGKWQPVKLQDAHHNGKDKD